MSSISRRKLLQLSAAGGAALGASASGWLPALADNIAAHPKRKRACILLWMSGGPSQTDTFDLKMEHGNGGPFKEIATSSPDVRIGEHLPKLAKWMDRAAIIRSMSTKEGDHARGTYLMRTGRLPQGPIQYPTLGSFASKEIAGEDGELPNFVSVSPYRLFSPAAFGPGFLGPLHAPLIVGDNGFAFNPQGQDDYEKAMRVQDLDLPEGVTAEQAQARVALLDRMSNDFLAGRPGAPSRSHRAAYGRAVRLMRSAAGKVFDLDDEPAALRDAYGRNRFGQGCLLARRLVERGVPFVEVSLGGINGQALGWDTHVDNFNNVQRLCGVLDPAWATLMDDLKGRGLLDSTLIVWMGEFGRTPKINRGNGRDHYPNAWTTVLAGGGISGGQAVGRTSEDGTVVETRPVTVPDLLATVCTALGIDPEKQNMSNVGRPIRLVEPGAQVLREVLA